MFEIFDSAVTREIVLRQSSRMYMPPVLHFAEPQSAG